MPELPLVSELPPVDERDDPVVDEPEVPDISVLPEEPDGLVIPLLPDEPDEPALPPPLVLWATAIPVPSAETRAAIKSFFMNDLHHQTT